MSVIRFGVSVGLGIFAATVLNDGLCAAADPVAGTATNLVAQNTYNGGSVPSQDSVIPAYLAENAQANRHAEIQAAETNLRISGGFMHTQYHENLQPGDDESGYTPGLGVGASVLLPFTRNRPASPDFYAALDYDIDAGNILYAGHLQEEDGGAPLDATDHAVFQRIEARLGVGFPLENGIESIPFFAFGYQAWNRNDTSAETIDGGEFYHSGLFGLGWKLDVPVTPTIVLSGDGEFLALAGGGITNPEIGYGLDFGRGFGVTPEERIELALDDQVAGHFHLFAKAFWEHFNYSGTHPEYYGDAGYAYEPLSTTTQFGLNVGAAYSF